MVSWSVVILATLGAGSAAYVGRDRLVEAKDVFGKPYKTWGPPNPSTGPSFLDKVTQSGRTPSAHPNPSNLPRP